MTKKIYFYLAVLFGMQTLTTSCGYNEMVSTQVNVDKTWANVQADYQRRLDLIPNLVETVKGEAKFEQETLTKVVEARASATKMTIDPSKATPAQMAEWQAAQGQLSAALGRLISISENYPSLKANQSFQKLSDEIEGCENRINTSRNNYNEAVATYNTLVRSIPQNLYAGMCGFTPRTPFEADAAAKTAPTVSFDKK